MNKFNFEKKTYDIIEYISNDILNIKNPIKYQNKIFNNHWNKYNNKIYDLFVILIDKLKNSIMTYNTESINDPNTKVFSHNWINNESSEPLIFKAIYEKLDKKLSFNQFNDAYNKKEINIKDFKTIIDDYINIHFIDNFSKQLINEQTEQTEQTQIYIDEIINVFKYFHMGSFISLDIKSYVENKINNCEIYEFDHLKLYFFTSTSTDIKIKNNLIKYIYIISKWIYSLNPIYKIKLAYYDTPFDKKLDFINKKFKFLSIQNINSGSSSSNNFIMIWRREELCKVLIHEIIHYLDIDVKHDENFNNLFNYNMGQIKYPILINETITEIQAQFLHTIYISYLSMDKTDNTDHIYDTFKILYQYELIFSWYQFSKIMDYYNIEKFKKKYLIKNFNQSTNVFTYYILKCLLTLNFATILFSLNHLTRLINIPKKNKCNVYSCSPIIKHIISNLKNPSKKLLKFINKIIKKLEFFDDSLRMTIFSQNDIF